jgi:hypothetical protein
VAVVEYNHRHLCGQCAATEATAAEEKNYPYRNKPDKENFVVAKQIIKQMMGGKDVNVA